MGIGFNLHCASGPLPRARADLIRVLRSPVVPGNIFSHDMAAYLVDMQQATIDMAREHLTIRHPQLDVTILRIRTESGVRTENLVVSLWRGNLAGLPMAVVDKAFRNYFQLRIAKHSLIEFETGGFIMGSPSTHAVVTQLPRNVLQPIDDAFTCTTQSGPEGFVLVASALDRFRLVEVYECDINTYFESTLAAYQQRFRDFISGAQSNPPTLGTCAPNAVAAVEENVRWMKAQRYDDRQLAMTKNEAETSQKPPMSPGFLLTRA